MAASELRDTYNAELFVLAVQSDTAGYDTLKRITGIESLQT